MQARRVRTDVYIVTDHDMGIDESYIEPTEQELFKVYLKMAYEFVLASNRAHCTAVTTDTPSNSLTISSLVRPSEIDFLVYRMLVLKAIGYGLGFEPVRIPLKIPPIFMLYFYDIIIAKKYHQIIVFEK